MPAMQTLLSSGLLVDLVIALTVVEGIALALYHRATGRGVAPRDYALNLASGLCLMLALRSVLAGAQWHWTAAALAAAGLAHGADIARRWQRQRGLIRPS
jgi:hypothetical protein